MSEQHEFDALFARLDDLVSRAERGEVGVSDFLTPREAHFAGAYLRRKGAAHILFGGYADAERKRVYLLPEYMDTVADISELEDYGFETGISAVCIKASGYRRLSHRDYLGSILGLGIERSVIGDILVEGEDGAQAYVFCDKPMCAFLLTALEKIANDKVKISEVQALHVPIPERRFAQINDTVASPRLDCIVGALCSLSREKAREAVVAGLVEADFECEERPDKTLSAPCMVSVRGYGRFRILSVEDQTRKGRFRLVAQKFL